MNLTGNTAIDVAIGLAFTFFLFSLLCSAIQEGFAGIFDLRARKLEAGLRSMLEDPGPGTGGAPGPVEKAKADVRAAKARKKIAENEERRTSGEVKAAAQARVNQAQNEIEAAEKTIADAERDVEEAKLVAKAERSLANEVLGHDLVRSAYKSSLVDKLWLTKLLPLRRRRGPSYLPARSFALALLDLLAPANPGADTLTQIRSSIAKANLPAGTKATLTKMAENLAKDRDHLRRLVEQWFDDTMGRVSGWYKRQSQIILCVIAAAVTIGLNVNTISIADRLIHDPTTRTALAQQATKFQPSKGTPKEKIQQGLKNVEDAGQAGLPFGWGKKTNNPAKVPGHAWRAIGGWILTIIALSLGAPFWFDALSKLARLRNSGVPEAPHETTPRKDAPSTVVETVKTTAGNTETTTVTTSTG